MLLTLLVSGCGTTSPPAEEIVGDGEDFIGLAAADEPRAVLVARDLLAAGGTAADAAAGLYFALSVTYPSAAALGGGGICIVYDHTANRGEVLDFLPRPPAAPGPVAVPGNARGMSALQSRFGRLRWEQVLSPAEQLARLGHPLSRAAVRAAASAGSEVTQSPGVAPLVTAAGRPRGEGDTLLQPALGTTLSRLRTSGAPDLYTGELSRRLLQDSAAAGGTLTEEDLRRQVAEWREPIRFEFDNIVMMVPPPPAGGEIVQRLWQATVREGGLIGSARVARDGLGKALGEAYSGTSGSVPVGGIATTGFAVADKDGNAVACTVTMQQPYGARLMAEGTGILMAAPPGGSDDITGFLSPLVGANLRVKQVFVAGAASGGAPAPAVLVEVLSAALAERQPLEKAMAAPRLFRAGPAAVMLHEPELPATLKASLQQQGIPLAEVSRLGRVNLIFCSNALPRDPASCRVRTDRRGHGLSVGEF